MNPAFGYYAHKEGSPEVIAYMERLLADGWQRFGMPSSWGCVFAHPDKPDMVHKVAFAPNKDGWVAYAKWLVCGDGDNLNPHFPRISNLDDHGKFVVADIERLEELNLMKNMRVQSEYSAASDAAVVPKNSTASVILQGMSLDLANAIMDLRQEFFGKWTMDVHSGNFMLRGETLVLTDPLSYMRPSYQRKIELQIAA